MPDFSRIVVKVGSSFLTDGNGSLNTSRLRSLVSQISRLRHAAMDVVLVSSGAIAAGMGVLQDRRRPKDLSQLQAMAAIGQNLLMHEYEKQFRRKKLVTAQILLTAEDLRDRTRYLNARNTLLALTGRGVVPVVNENDTVATDEIRFGDNDRLSSLVASLVDAGLLIILSDVDGVYDRQGALIPRVDRIGPELMELAGKTTGHTTVGGMVTKLEAARIAVNSGIPVIIANGRTRNILPELVQGKGRGTRFSVTGKMAGKKRWIAFGCRSCGRIIVDAGAREAVVSKGRSLLASGIISCEGKFLSGDLVLICDEDGNEVARGLVNYSSEELVKIQGSNTSRIESLLGYKTYDEVVHRDNLAVLK